MSYQPNWYYGFGASPYRLEDADTDSHISFGAFSGRVGINMNEFLAVEGHLGLSDWKNIFSSSTYGNVDARLIVSSIYLKAKYEQEKYTFYGLVGTTSLKVETSGTLGFPGFFSADVSSSETESGASYGVGVDLFGNKTTSVTFMILRTLEEKNADVNSFNIGFNYFFDRPSSY